MSFYVFFFFSSRRRHTRSDRDWSSDVCSSDLIDPVWTSGAVTFATSGGSFVSGPQWGAWSGSLFVATLKDKDLRRFEVTGTTVTQKDILFDQKYGRLRSVIQGPDGALYVTTSNGSGDRIIRIA